MPPLGHYVLADIYNRQGRRREGAQELARGRALDAQASEPEAVAQRGRESGTGALEGLQPASSLSSGECYAGAAAQNIQRRRMYLSCALHRRSAPGSAPSHPRSLCSEPGPAASYGGGVEQVDDVRIDAESVPLDPERLLGPQIDLVEEVVPLGAARLEEDLPRASTRQVQLAGRDTACTACTAGRCSRSTSPPSSTSTARHPVRHVGLDLVPPGVRQLTVGVD